jgi:hypothetical protein
MSGDCVGKHVAIGAAGAARMGAMNLWGNKKPAGAEAGGFRIFYRRLAPA